MSSTVRISESGRLLLSELAREAGKSMTDVLDAALETYRRDRFLARAAEAYEAISADDLADYRREIDEWDGTGSDGLSDYPS